MLSAVSSGRIRARAISTSALYESPFYMFDVLLFALSKYAGASPRFVWACTSRFDHLKLHKMPAPVVAILCSFMIIVFENRFWIVDGNEVN
jgi:heme/copper-type cytochrome/quinol oxidase subunit 1